MALGFALVGMAFSTAVAYLIARNRRGALAAVGGALAGLVVGVAAIIAVAYGFSVAPGYEEWRTRFGETIANGMLNAWAKAGIQATFGSSVVTAFLLWTRPTRNEGPKPAPTQPDFNARLDAHRASLPGNVSRWEAMRSLAEERLDQIEQSRSK